MAKAEQPVLSFATPSELEAWLGEHAEDSDGIWLKFAKKGSGIRSVVYAEALESALCHGWIDGQVKRLDEVHAATGSLQVVEAQPQDGRATDRGGPHESCRAR